MAKQGSVKLHGRFPPGTDVRLVKVDGAHVLRPGPADETVDEQTVNKDGELSFSKGVKAGERYFAVAQVNGEPREVRLTGGQDDDGEGSHLAMYDGGIQALTDRQKLSDGTFVDEPPEQHSKQEVPEGATWLGQHQVPKGTLQRSDTPRGAAAIISAEERERAVIQWRKQEPPNQVIEETPDPGSEPARTAEPPDMAPAKSTSRAASKPAAKKEAK